MARNESLAQGTQRRNQPIPEPGTLTLMGIGLLGVVRKMRRNR
jgi:hypothetical protein